MKHDLNLLKALSTALRRSVATIANFPPLRFNFFLLNLLYTNYQLFPGYCSVRNCYQLWGQERNSQVTRRVFEITSINLNLANFFAISSFCERCLRQVCWSRRDVPISEYRFTERDQLPSHPLVTWPPPLAPKREGGGGRPQPLLMATLVSF